MAAAPGPHAVTRAGNLHYSYDNNGNVLTERRTGASSAVRTFTYHAFNKVKSITKGTHTTSFAYGPARTRIKRTDTVVTGSGASTTTTLYLGNVEKVIAPDGSFTFKRYIADGVLVEQTHDTGGNRDGEDTRYLLYDHLGSIDVITDAAGTVVQDLSFDAWGQRRAPDDWTVLALMRLMDTTHGSITPYGFTGHEMLDAVGIIHMNGRIYDPTLGRFLQADPIIQFPNYSQSWNRYSYVLNNPLNATDPTGYFPIFGALAVVGLIAADITSKIIIAAVIGTAVFADSLAQGVPLDKAFLAGVSAAALTAAASGTFPTPTQGGFGWNVATYGHLASVAAVGGITASLQGGKFGHGFLSAGIGAAVGGIPALQGVGAGRVAARTMVSAVTAGTVSEITGGKFANGAMTAAFFSLVSSAAQAARLNGRNSSPNDPILTPEQRADLAKRQGLAVDDINAAYESGALGDGRGFNTIDEASKEVLGVLDPISRRHQVEIGGFIFPSVEDYVYGRPIIGTGSSIPGLVNVPDSAVAGFHTHPSGARYFSIRDVRWVKQTGIPLYLSGNDQVRACDVSGFSCSLFKANTFPQTSWNPGLQGRIIP